MNKAFIQHLLKTSQKKGAGFIFDMDGVIVDSERAWHTNGTDFLNNLYGKDLLSKMGSLVGLTIDSEYELATRYGFRMAKDKYYEKYDKQAAMIYKQAKITRGVGALIRVLEKMDFKLALVSASRRRWVDVVLARISSKDIFHYVLSTNDRQDLRPKPHQDSYLEAMKRLNVLPQNSIILEDSNRGIAAARASGAFTIAFTQNLVSGYKQIDADAKAKNMEEVIAIVENFFGA